MSKKENNPKQKIAKAIKYGVLAFAGGAAVGIGGYKLEVNRRRHNMEKQISVQTDKRFQKFLSNLMSREGTISPSFIIGDDTSYGITQTTLDLVHQEYGVKAKDYAKSIWGLKAEHAVEIIKNEYYNRRRIADIKNESVAELMFDVAVNHSSQTWRGFAAKGIEKVNNYGMHDSRPTDWSDVVDVLNTYNNKELEMFYNTVVRARIDFLTKDVPIEKYNGLIKRAESFKGKFKPETTIGFYDAVRMNKCR